MVGEELRRFGDKMRVKAKLDFQKVHRKKRAKDRAGKTYS